MNYRYEAFEYVDGFGTKLREWGVQDHNTNLILATHLSKKEASTLAKLLSHNGTVALAAALGEYNG